jgi:hypothetical protein
MCSDMNALDKLIWDADWDAVWSQYSQDDYPEFDYDEYLKAMGVERRQRACIGGIYNFSGKKFDYVKIIYIGDTRADVRVVDFDGYLNEFVDSNVTFSVRFADERWGNLVR